MNQSLKCIEEIILNLNLHLAKLLINCAANFIQLIEDLHQLNKVEIQDIEK